MRASKPNSFSMSSRAHRSLSSERLSKDLCLFHSVFHRVQNSLFVDR